MTLDGNSTTIIVAIIAAVASIITAGISLKNRSIGSSNGSKLDVIHVLVNSNLEKLRKDLADALREIERLNALLAALDG